MADRPEVNVTHNSEVVSRDLVSLEAAKLAERVLSPEAQQLRMELLTNADKVKNLLERAKPAFMERGFARNWEGLMESEFLIRRSILDRLIDPYHEIDRECGYPADITPLMYHLLYERDPIANRVVSLMPEECWMLHPEIFETEDDEETEFESAWKELEKRLHCKSMLQRADRLSGIGRFGAILLGLADGLDYSQPAEGIDDYGEKIEGSENQLLFLRAFDEIVIRVNLRESNMNNPRFGQPTMYTVTFKDLDITEMAGSGIATVGDVTKRVHWTRIIHLADGRAMSEIYGTPRMKPVWNRVQDLRKLYGGSGEMFWKGGFPGISFEMNPGVGDVSLDNESLRQQIESYQSGLQRYIALTGMTAKSLAVEVADPSPHIDKQLEALCLCLGVPKRVFMGSEKAELASSQDAKTWNGRKKKRNEDYTTPHVIRPFVDRLIALGILPEPLDGYEVYWPDIDTLTDGEKADIAVKKSQAMNFYVTGGCDVVMGVPDYLERILGEDPDSIEDIMSEVPEESEVHPAPEPGDPAGASGGSKSSIAAASSEGPSQNHRIMENQSLMEQRIAICNAAYDELLHETTQENRKAYYHALRGVQNAAALLAGGIVGKDQGTPRKDRPKKGKKGKTPTTGVIKGAPKKDAVEGATDQTERA